MTSDPRAFFALDEGAATTSAAIIARLGGRWRLLASTAFPAAIPTDAILGLLMARLRDEDPAIADAIGAKRDAVTGWTRLAVRSRPTGRLAVVAGAERAVAPFAAAATAAGWRVVPGSAERLEPLAMTTLLVDPDIDAVLVGAGEPPGADERPTLDDLAALVAAAVARRPGLTIVLAGAMVERAGRFDGIEAGTDLVLARGPSDGAGGEALRTLLLDLRVPPDDPRRAIVQAIGSLADALDRRIELLEVGIGGGLRVHADPGAGGDPGSVRAEFIAAGGLTGEEREDDAVDDLMAWSTMALDRHRMRDRLRELRTAPWGDCAGDGARLRLAAARAALTRLVAATPALSALAAPDLLVTAGGAWAVAPGPAIALALIDVVRRPGASHLAFDHARLLGPLGAIDDPTERRAIVRDLADDLLAPLGSVVMPQGLHGSRSAGRVVVHRGADVPTEIDLSPGGLELVDLPPGATAVAEFHFRDSVRLGVRGRTFAVDVAGGLGGLLVDLRDVPMRLPDRQDRRRELLAGWQAALWGGGEG